MMKTCASLENEILNTIANSGIPNPGGERHFVDGDRYQGDQGGVVNGTYSDGNSSSERQAAGYTVGKADFKNILSQLKKDPKTGKIIEEIQIYTHSRGAAFGVGYTTALLQEIKENADLFEDADNVIDFVYNMAPNQSNSLTSPEGVDSYTHDHTADLLSGDDMKGVKAAFKSDEKGSGPLLRSHSISGFVKDVGAFLNAVRNNDGHPVRTVNDL
jgi:hypothetical protein